MPLPSFLQRKGAQKELVKNSNQVEVPKYKTGDAPGSLSSGNKMKTAIKALVRSNTSPGTSNNVSEPQRPVLLVTQTEIMNKDSEKRICSDRDSVFENKPRFVNGSRVRSRSETARNEEDISLPKCRNARAYSVSGSESKSELENRIRQADDKKVNSKTKVSANSRFTENDSVKSDNEPLHLNQDGMKELFPNLMKISEDTGNSLIYDISSCKRETGKEDCRDLSEKDSRLDTLVGDVIFDEKMIESQAQSLVDEAEAYIGATAEFLAEEENKNIKQHNSETKEKNYVSFGKAERISELLDSCTPPPLKEESGSTWAFKEDITDGKSLLNIEHINDESKVKSENNQMMQIEEVYCHYVLQEEEVSTGQVKEERNHASLQEKVSYTLLLQSEKENVHGLLQQNQEQDSKILQLGEAMYSALLLNQERKIKSEPYLLKEETAEHVSQSKEVNFNLALQTEKEISNMMLLEEVPDEPVFQQDICKALPQTDKKHDTTLQPSYKSLELSVKEIKNVAMPQEENVCDTESQIKEERSSEFLIKDETGPGEQKSKEICHAVLKTTQTETERSRTVLQPKEGVEGMSSTQLKEGNVAILKSAAENRDYTQLITEKTDVIESQQTKQTGTLHDDLGTHLAEEEKDYVQLEKEEDGFTLTHRDEILDVSLPLKVEIDTVIRDSGEFLPGDDQNDLMTFEPKSSENSTASIIEHEDLGISVQNDILPDESTNSRNWKVGYLQMKLPAKSRGRGKLKAWQKKWVVIQADEFFEDKKNRSLMLSIYQSDSSSSRRHNAAFWKTVCSKNAVIYRSMSRTHPYSFTITDGTDAIVHLAGDSESESQEWMSAIRSILWPPGPLMQLEKGKVLNGNEFEVSIIDNDFAYRAGLLGAYGYLTVTNRKLILCHPQTGHVVQEWYLNTVDKFELLQLPKEEDKKKVLVMYTSRDSSTGCGEIKFFCNEAISFLQSIASTIHKVLQHHSKSNVDTYKKELEELADWLTPQPSPVFARNPQDEDYYKVPPRQVRSLLDVPNFLFDKDIQTVVVNEILGPKLTTSKTCVSTFSEDSGISVAPSSDDFLNCSSTSFTIGNTSLRRHNRTSSGSDLSDTYSPPITPKTVRKDNSEEKSECSYAKC